MGVGFPDHGLEDGPGGGVIDHGKGLVATTGRGRIQGNRGNGAGAVRVEETHDSGAAGGSGTTRVNPPCGLVEGDVAEEAPAAARRLFRWTAEGKTVGCDPANARLVIVQGAADC